MPERKKHEIGPGFIKKMNNWFFALGVIVLLLICFTVFTFLFCANCGVNIEKSNDATYINVIITIAGFLAAFSAISIYSIFNTNIDREKNNLENLAKDVVDLEKDLKNQITNKTQTLDEQLQNQIDNFKKSEKELNDYINLVKSINDLTSPYSIARKKSEAIFYFSEDYVNKNLNKDVKELILNFYNSLESNEEEKSKPYYKKLEDLLRQWGMID